MLEIEQTKTFKKCLKKYRHKKAVLNELKEIVDLLANEKPIAEKFRDHELKGKYRGIRELHIRPDDLLLYVKRDGKKLILMAIGSHAEIF